MALFSPLRNPMVPDLNITRAEELVRITVSSHALWLLVINLDVVPVQSAG